MSKPYLSQYGTRLDANGTPHPYWRIYIPLKGLSRMNGDLTAIVRDIIAQGISRAEESLPRRQDEQNVAEDLLDEYDKMIREIVLRPDSADNKMRAICGIDRSYLEWSSPRWAKLLDVSEAAIRKTPFWRKGRKEAQKALKRDEHCHSNSRY